MGGFSVAQGTRLKRSLGQQAPAAAQPIKVPRASEVTLAQPAAKPTQSFRSLPMSAPVNVCMYRVTDCAEDVWDAVGDVPLYQIQIEHNAQRAITFHI